MLEVVAKVDFVGRGGDMTEQRKRIHEFERALLALDSRDQGRLSVGGGNNTSRMAISCLCPFPSKWPKTARCSPGRISSGEAGSWLPSIARNTWAFWPIWNNRGPWRVSRVMISLFMLCTRPTNWGRGLGEGGLVSFCGTGWVGWPCGSAPWFAGRGTAGPGPATTGGPAVQP